MKQFILAVIVLIGWTIAFMPIKASALTISPVRFEISGDPGQTLIGEITLFNEREIAETFYSSFESFEARGEEGNPSFVPAQKGLPTWMKTEPKITLEPGETKIIPFSIEIPKEADPGGHFAAIFWSNVPPIEAGEEQMVVGARIGTLVLLRVSGEIREGGGILEFGTENRIYTHLPISLFYRLANDGNNWLRPEGEIKISNIIGLQTAILDANPVKGNVLPGSVRRFDIEWGMQGETTEEGGFLAIIGHQWRNFAFGPYRATLTLRNGILPESETTEGFKSSFWLFVIPWQLLIIIIIVLIIVGFLGAKGLNKYNRWVISKYKNLENKK